MARERGATKTSISLNIRGHHFCWPPGQRLNLGVSFSEPTAHFLATCDEQRVMFADQRISGRANAK